MTDQAAPHRHFAHRSYEHSALCVRGKAGKERENQLRQSDSTLSTATLQNWVVGTVSRPTSIYPLDADSIVL